MPSAACHSFFWADAGAAPDPPLGASASGGYVPWMTTVTRLMGLMNQPCWQLRS